MLIVSLESSVTGACQKILCRELGEDHTQLKAADRENSKQNAKINSVRDKSNIRTNLLYVISIKDD